MVLKFKINKHYLAAYAVASLNKPFPAWKKLENRLWQKYQNNPAYYFLNPKHINWALEQIWIEENFKKSFSKIISELNTIYKEILESKEFKRLYKETKKYLKFIRNQWLQNKKQALKILQNLCGFKLSKKEISVYLTHPGLFNGKAIPEKNVILWGHPENWKNYSTVYLCHELMHILTWKKQKDHNVMHALIEFITDEELRIQLNRKGVYFKEKQRLVGHRDLISLKKKILPYWKKYLKGKLGKNIFELERILIEKDYPKNKHLSLK